MRPPVLSTCRDLRNALNRIKLTIPGTRLLAGKCRLLASTGSVAGFLPPDRATVVHRTTAAARTDAPGPMWPCPRRPCPECPIRRNPRSEDKNHPQQHKFAVLRTNDGNVTKVLRKTVANAARTDAARTNHARTDAPGRQRRLPRLAAQPDDDRMIDGTPSAASANPISQNPQNW